MSGVFLIAGVTGALSNDAEHIQQASHLALIVARGELCGYEVRSGRLEKLYLERGLTTMEMQSLMDKLIAVNRYNDRPDEAACSQSEANSRQLGLTPE
nr:hypothetical protein RNT25_04385 [arsenite-oxidising bacterium NT-25]